MKHEWKGGRKGAGRWSLTVTQICCELLVCGASPAAIPSIIATLYEILYGESPKDVPSIRYVLRCRVVVQVIGETLTAMKLASVKDWKQIFFDATTRRQIPFTAVIIGLMGDGKLDPVVVSSCIFLEDESADKTAEGIIDKVSTVCGMTTDIVIVPISNHAIICLGCSKGKFSPLKARLFL